MSIPFLLLASRINYQFFSVNLFTFPTIGIRTSMILMIIEVTVIAL